MNRPKFERGVYIALRDADHSNRRIASMLGVNEASVRRALKDAPPRTPRRKVTFIVIEEA